MKYSFLLLIAALIVPFILIGKGDKKDNVIVDSNFTWEQAIKGTNATKEVLDELYLLDVKYYSIDGKIHKGQIIIAKELKNEVKEVFELILKEKFPVNKVIPIVKYNWSDSASMADNNSSSFCYRVIAGTNKLSQHALGRAVDINPYFNPFIENGIITPKGGKYDTNRKGTFTKDSPIVKKFIELGWRWGGNFNDYKDYHHFDKKKV